MLRTSMAQERSRSVSEWRVESAGRAGCVAALVTACVLRTLSPAHGAAGLVPGVSIVQSDARGLTVEYAPPAPQIEPTQDPDGGARITVGGHIPCAIPGHPDLPGTFLRFGLPARGEPRVVVESIEYAPFGSARIAPVAAVAGTYEEPRQVFAFDPEIYGASAPFPRAPAELGETFLFDGQRAASLVLWPVRWNPRTRALDAVTRLRVRVEFPPARVAAGKGAAAPLSADAENSLRALLVNFETARAFREPAAARKSAGALGGPGAGSRGSRGAGDSFASSNTWLRVKIPTKGVYEITYESLAAAGITNPGDVIGSTATLRLYNGGGLELPDSLLAPRPEWMKQIPLLLQDDGDGRLEPGEAIVFYALALDGFLDEFNDSLASDVHFHSRFADDNIYWLTWGGTFSEPAARMTPPVDGRVIAGSGATPAFHFLHRTHEEQDIIEDYTRPGEDGWFWADFRTGTDKRFFTSSPGADTSLAATLHIRLYGHRQTEGGATGSRYQGNAVWNGAALGDSNFTWDDRASSTSIRKIPFDFFYEGRLATGRADTLRVRVLPPLSEDVYMCWFELAYQRRFDAAGQKIFRFSSPADTGRIHYDIARFTGTAPLLIDVTDLFGARLVTGWSVSGDTLSFEAEESRRRRYALYDETALLTPSEIRAFPIQDLRDPELEADYLMIVADVAQSAASRLRDLRDNEFAVQLVPLSQVVAQFGWGIAEPAAIRDFLQYAVTHWDGGVGPGAGRVPRHVLFAGDATKDYRGLRRSANKNLVPTHYEVSPDGQSINTFATDDWFAYLAQDTSGDGVLDVYDDLEDVAIGRLPISGASDLQTMVSKIVQYETNPELGDWRSRVLFVADDEMKGCPDRDRGSPCWDRFFLQQHTDDVEGAARLVPDAFDKIKIYLTEYPFGNSAEKPAAKRAYLDALRKGVLLSHYAGHGGFDKMADENVFFSSDADATKIQNGNRLYIFTAYSCSIGTFDLADQSSIAELLLRSAGGGSIASFASSAPAFAGSSSALGNGFVSELFVPPGGGTQLRVGEAIRISKTKPSVLRSRTNDEKYVYLGDPALRFALPKYEVRIDPHPNFTSASPDTVSGSVIDGDSLATWFDGTASVFVEGSADTSGYDFYPPPDSTRRHVRYHLPGGTIYRGDVRVTDGRWQASFFVPVDLRVGRLARVRAYVTNGLTDGLGFEDSLVTIRSALPDSGDLDVTGPVITLSLDGRAYHPGITALPAAELSVRISDPHGINLQGDDDFFAVSVTIDERTVGERTLDLTRDFRYDFGKNDVGGLTVDLSSVSSTGVQPGRHTLTIHASDNYNNRSLLEAEVEIVGESETLDVTEPVNFPNPFSEETEIQYSLTQNADVTVRIFTVNGRMIREFRNIRGQIGRNEDLTWDGRDQDGDPVANGLYFFKVAAKSEDPDRAGQEDEAIGKAVVMRK